MYRQTYVFSFVTTFFALVLNFLPADALAQTKGAGSSFARDLMTRLTSQYGPANGGVTYEATGSVAGVKALTAQSVAFAVSDTPLTGPALDQMKLVQIPLAGGAVAVVVNVPGLPQGKKLRLNGTLLADIYLGTVTNWNHTTIKALNPEINLPDLKITPIYREDGSGMTAALTTYMARYNGSFSRRYGSGSLIAFPVGLARRGGAGVLEGVKATPGAIGYDALANASASGLHLLELQNAMARFVAPTTASVAESLSRANWDTTRGAFPATNAADLDASPGLTAWPVSIVTYALVPASGATSANRFLAQALTEGDGVTTGAGFVPINPQVKAVVLRTLAR
jgi:phosphate transport system substrate-binding protein